MYREIALFQVVRTLFYDDMEKAVIVFKPTTSTYEIMDKLEEIYGEVESLNKIIHDFCLIVQNEQELVSALGVRVETLFQKAVYRGEVIERKVIHKLKIRF